MSINKKDEDKYKGDNAGIYEPMLKYNNFNNLESVEFKSIESIHPLYVLYTSHRTKKRFYSSKFMLDEFYSLLCNFFVVIYSENTVYTSKKTLISQIFKIYFDIDKTWLS